MKDTTKFILLISLVIVAEVRSARILAYFPTPSISHQIVFRPLTQALAKRGHEVIVITADPAFPKGGTPSNLTEIDVHDVSYNIWKKSLKYYNANQNSIIDQVKIIFESITSIFDAQMNSLQVKNILKNKDKKYFDLLLLEPWTRPLLGLTHKFEAPAIFISSFGAVTVQYNIFGAPTHPLLYPTAGRQRLYNLTWFEKVLELCKFVAFEFLIQSTEDYDLIIMKKHFGDDLPNFRVLEKRVKMMFLNEHPIWADNHPVPPSIVYIRGILQPENKDLPQDLKSYLDSSKQGVIYVSFGTNVLSSLLPPEKIEIMTKVFSKLPYNILWKWDQDVLPGQSHNIKIAKWFPQPELLKHPNLKLFITQGGLQSTDEAIDAAVPVIGIPMLSDQWYNTEKYVHHKIGCQLDISTFTERDLNETIKLVMETESYKDNIIKLRTLMKESPIKPVDNAVWWTEHVIKHGGDHLRSPANQMTFAEYYEAELILVVLSITLVIFTLAVLVIKKLLKIVYKCFMTRYKIKLH